MQPLFARIDQYLTVHSPYWRFLAFPLQDYPDLEGNTALIALLESLDDQQLSIYQEKPNQFYPILKQVIPSLLDVNDPLFQLEDSQTEVELETPFWLKTGIKGRKWTQIDGFSDQVGGQLPVLEWCAGKGHLGRLIHYKHQVPVSAVEWNAALCDQGVKQAKQLNVSQQFFTANVLTGEADKLLTDQQHAVALHACGDLHIHLIKQAIQAETKKLTISPCCYHLIEGEVYKPVSIAAKHSRLLSGDALTKQLLKFTVSQQATSGARQTRLNDREVWWRLSFDSLQKQLLNTAQYLNVPAFPKALLSTDFKEFAQWVIARKSLPFCLPSDCSIFLEHGQMRFNRLRRIELVTRFFQRPLELWLVLDRALSLQEAGYHVQLSTFCGADITPRNLLIQASRD